jgi:hypothetical protein
MRSVRPDQLLNRPPEFSLARLRVGANSAERACAIGQEKPVCDSFGNQRIQSLHQFASGDSRHVINLDQLEILGRYQRIDARLAACVIAQKSRIRR